MTIKFRNSKYREAAAEPLRYTACGLDDVYLVNGFTREIVDGEEFITVADMDGLWKAIGLHLVLTKKSLAPKEVRFLRDHMDMTQAKLGTLLRVTDQTVARWEKGETELPGPADFMLRVLFLDSPVAQPQGSEILQKVKKLCEEIVSGDDLLQRPVVFKHSEHSRKWKKTAQLQLAYA